MRRLAALVLLLAVKAAWACSFSLDALNWGQITRYDSSARNRTATARITCPAGTAWKITAAQNRVPVTIGGVMHYVWLTQDAARASLITVSSGPGGTGTGAEQTAPVYLRLSASGSDLNAQPTATGAFTVSIPLTLIF